MSQATHDKDILERLHKANLVDKRERTALLKQIRQMEEWDKKNDSDMVIETGDHKLPYYPLQVLQRAKIFSTAGTLSMTFTPAPVTIPKSKEKEYIGKLADYNNRLLKEGLISQATFAELTRDINDLALRSEYEVTEAAAFGMEKEYFLAPTKFKKFANQLLERELLTRKNYDELLDRSVKGELRNYTTPLEYINGIVWIDPAEYSGAPEAYLEKFYRKAAGAFPGLSFDKLSFTVKKNEKESEKDFVINNISVTLEKEGKKYRYTSYWDAEYKNKQKAPHANIPEQFHQVFNKILADQFSPYRLHIINGWPGGSGRFGVLALTKKQFEGLQWMYDGQSVGYINVSYENFTNKITKKKITDAITLYDSIGLLSHLTQTEKDSCIQEIESAEINYYSDILRFFKDLVFEIDLEYGIADKQYEKLTKMLASISRGAFNPSAIIDTYNFDRNKSFDYGFTLNDKTYKTKLKQEVDWIDLALFDFIEKAMAEQDKKGKFHYLHPADGARYIYLTNEQADILKQKKMIELSETDVAD